MAKRLFSRIVFNSNITSNLKSSTSGNIQFKKIHTNEVPVKEIQIPIQWGHISAKLWGSGEERPILALHGWQDNAGTWDPLAPQLIKNNNRPILAVDFPGHGFSSWIAPGLNYYPWEYIRVIQYLKEYFKWDKISLLAHSLGSVACFSYASLFPDDVDFYIAVDNIISDDIDFNLDKFPLLVRKSFAAQSHLDQEPPSYSLEEIINILHFGSGKSVSMESAQHLLKRGAKKSKLDPEKYNFTRDPRLKYVLFNPDNKKFIEAMAMRLKCPSLYFKATDSPRASSEFAIEICEMIEQNNDKFERHLVPGTHHVHLNNPEVILPHILNFLRKYNFMK